MEHSFWPTNIAGSWWWTSWKHTEVSWWAWAKHRCLRTTVHLRVSWSTRPVWSYSDFLGILLFVFPSTLHLKLYGRTSILHHIVSAHNRTEIEKSPHLLLVKHRVVSSLMRLIQKAEYSSYNLHLYMQFGQLYVEGNTVWFHVYFKYQKNSEVIISHEDAYKWLLNPF